MNTPRPDIDAVLVRLRRWVRRYVLLQGLALLVVAACVLFWLTFGIDIAYFRFSQLELPRWFRVLAVILSATLAAALLAIVAARLFRRMKPADLALALERQFPSLNDRLITAVELAGRTQSPLHQQMFERTAEEAAETLSQLPLATTLDPRPLRRSMIAALTLAVSVLALGLADAQGMERWYRAYLLGQPDYWEAFRRNALRVQVLAQPGDRIREFDASGTYRHPRGADLHLVGTVPEKAEPSERVDLQFISLGSAKRDRGRVSMSRLGKSEFQQTLSRVTTDHELWFHAGDYTNRSPYRIQVVEPPRIETIKLFCDYPSYTGMDSREDAPISVVGVQTLLPMETAFWLECRVNKPLLRVHVHCETLDLTFGDDLLNSQRQPTPTRLTVNSKKNANVKSITLPRAADTFFDAPHTTFRIPFRITLKAAEALASETLADASHIPLPPDETLRITLEDDDQIYSLEPVTLTINGAVDQPPVVESRRIGVGPLVTRIAKIPIEGQLTDDYGVAKAWFAYRVDQAPEEARQDLTRPPANQKEFPLKQSDTATTEDFNLIPLNLQEGQNLLLAVYAEDGDTFNGPHRAHGEYLTFKIVSKEELLSKMLDREVNLRSRFEQIRKELGDLREDVVDAQKQAADLAAGKVAENLSPAVVAAYVDRALHQIRKNHTESRSVEVSFRDMRDELVNNRIDTAEMLERLDGRIVVPMGILNTTMFLAADQSLGAFRLAVERGIDSARAGEAVLPAIDQILSQMDQLLLEMKSRGSSNELIQDLTRLIEEQMKLLEETENKRIQDQFFSPFN